MRLPQARTWKDVAEPAATQPGKLAGVAPSANPGAGRDTRAALWACLLDETRLLHGPLMNNSGTAQMQTASGREENPDDI